MKIYNYSYLTYEYLSTSDATEDPLEKGRYLIPAYATDIQPPEYEKNQTPIFNVGTKVWNVVDDYRNQNGCEIDKNVYFIRQHLFTLGEKPSSTLILASLPNTSLLKPKWDSTNNQWVDDLNAVKQNKCQQIENKCKQMLTSGFVSTAYQNISKTYSSTLENQSNIQGNAISAMSKIAGTPGCENDKFYYHAQGEEFVEWTAQEVLTLARDWKVFKEQQLFKSKSLQTYVNDVLTTVDSVKSVTWDTEMV
ncbi:hypothetical protein [Clostridium felsineum]|uniref:DUF4376 domain-containing protein n=1 Tax=Clostridium felsineum TaxID=36839 RepID=UPI00098BF4C1|nr:hypothetical protein [Clostridium felsineum]URZ18784.1 hypothetical protein CLFE_048720 [Clostridium felsineum DSM 794]